MHRSACWLHLLLFFTCGAAPQTDTGPDCCGQDGLSDSLFQTHVYSINGADTLMLDLRMPVRKVPGSPGVIFLHGGGFSQGQRDRGPHVQLLDTLCAKGIVSASISYRLTMTGKGFGCQVPALEKQGAVATAAEDLNAARSWLELADPQLPKSWIAMGSSAGAEAAMWAGFGLAENRYAGVVAFSGAIADSAAVDASAPPFFGVHGTCDEVVPPNQAIHRRCGAEDPGAWALCGGMCWAERMAAQGRPAHFHGYCGGDHAVCNAAMTDSALTAALIAWIVQPELHTSQFLGMKTEGGIFAENQDCPPCQ